jgi:hypothetical protein
MKPPRTLAGLGFAVALALSTAAAQTSDPVGRALLERQQQSDAFSLQLQQSIQRFRAGDLPPQRRLELESLHRDQRLQQGETFYRQQVQQQQTEQTTGPASPLRDAEAMRFEQDRQQQLSRYRWDADQAGAPGAEPPRPLVEPGVVTAPVPRGRGRKPLPRPEDLGP